MKKNIVLIVLVCILSILVLIMGMYIFSNEKSQLNIAGGIALEKNNQEMNLLNESVNKGSIANERPNSLKETTNNELKTTEQNEKFNLDLYKSLINSLSDQMINYFEVKYSILDINNDNIPELITLVGSCEADSRYTIYSQYNGNIVYVDMINGGHSSLGMYGENNLQHSWAHQGEQIESHYAIENYKLKLIEEPVKILAEDTDDGFSKNTEIRFYNYNEQEGFNINK